MIVRENIDFVRGQDPRDILKLGLETVIPNQFDKFRILDKNNDIENLCVDTPYNSFYLYLSSKAVSSYDPYENTKEENEEVKEKIREKINSLLKKSGLSEYFVYDSHENADEICYKIKPQYKKVLKKLQDDLNT